MRYQVGMNLYNAVVWQLNVDGAVVIVCGFAAAFLWRKTAAIGFDFFIFGAVMFEAFGNFNDSALFAARGIKRNKAQTKVCATVDVFHHFAVLDHMAKHGKRMC